MAAEDFGFGFDYTAIDENRVLELYEYGYKCVAECCNVAAVRLPPLVGSYR